MKFIIYKVKNGFLLTVQHGKKMTSYIFQATERIRMLAHIDKLLGDDPAEQLETEKND